MRLPLAIKLLHARDGLRHVLDRALDRFEILAGPLAQARFAFEQRLGVKRDRRNGVVDVVGNAAGHLAERAQTLLLHDGCCVWRKSS